MKRVDVWLTVLSVLFVINLVVVVFLWMNAGVLLQPSQSTRSEVFVDEFYSFNPSFSASGIVYDTVTSAPFDNNNASLNYAGVGSTTLYNISVRDSSTPLEICVHANSVLSTDAGVEFGVLSGQTIIGSLTNDASNPGPPSSSQSLTTTAALIPGLGSIPNNADGFLRSWLDVPADVQTGLYNNTITFTGQPEGTGC